MSPPTSTPNNPLKEFLLLVSVTSGLVWVRDPMRALINWKPGLPPCCFVLLVLLKQQAETRATLLMARGNVTTRGRLGCWIKEDHVWKPGDALGVISPWPVALFSRKWPRANKDKTIEHLLPLRMKICVTPVVQRRCWQVVREHRMDGRRGQL